MEETFSELLLVRLFVAAAAGFVIGIERTWSVKGMADDQSIAGMRTFTVAGLAGGVCAILPGSVALLAVLVGAIGVLVSFTQWLTASRIGPGLTTELALLLTPLLGALATTHPLEATAAAALIAGMLGLKQELHGFVDRLGRDEWLASLQLLIVAVVVLPLLPNENMGPWNSINPRTIGWLVLFLLGVSYVGYFAVRIMGPGRGVLLTGLLGGLASSTALTLSYARFAARSPAASELLSGGITLSCAVMAMRVWIVTSTIRPDLAPLLGPPLAALAVVPLLYAVYVARHTRVHPTADVPIGNPFALRAALAMAAGITGLSVLIAGAGELVGRGGVYAIAALSGILDVDAVSVAMARSAASQSADRLLPGELPLAIAGTGILLAVGVNTVSKTVMATVAGTRELGLRCFLVLGVAAAIAAGIVIAGPWMPR